MTETRSSIPDPFLIIGGYGAVGSHAVEMLRTFQPDLPLVVAGRSAEKAAAAAARHDKVRGIAVDTSRIDLGIPADLAIGGIAVLTDELSTTAAAYAMERGIPFFSIATTLGQIQPKLTMHIRYAARSASLILDTSFAGTVAVEALNFTADFVRIDNLAIMTLMDEEDLGGASAEQSEEYAATLVGLIREDSRWIAPNEAKASRTVTLLDGSQYEGSSFATFDVAELVLATGAASSRLEFALGMTPGRGCGGAPTAEVLYEIAGELKDGRTELRHVQLTHPQGQTALTGVGVAVAIEVLAGLVTGPVAPGIYLPTTLIPAAHMHERLLQTGATIATAVKG